MGLLSSIGRLFPVAAAILPSRGTAAGAAETLGSFGSSIPGPVGAIAGIATSLAQAGVIRGTAGQLLGGGGMQAHARPQLVTPAGVMKVGGGAFLEPPSAGRPASNVFGMASNRTLAKQQLTQWGFNIGLTRALRRREFLSLVNKFGFAVTGRLVGATDSEVAFVWFVVRRRRRMTGISARDVRRVQRAQATVRKARKLSQAFGRFAPRARRVTRRAIGPGVVQIQQE